MLLAMDDWLGFLARLAQSSARVLPAEHPPRIAVFTDPAAEYAALGVGTAIVPRSDRGLLEITGKDRVGWLHNLTTNQVKTLPAGDGTYAFVLNVQGRILFDVNILMRTECIWLDLDRRFLETARKHFAKYTITEDVAVTEITDRFVRLGLVGSAAADVASALGAGNAKAMPQLGQSVLPAESTDFMRHDFCGPFGLELFVPPDRAAGLWTDLTKKHGAIPVGEQAVQVRRIEAGIPWPGSEISSEYLPAETRQQERAVSFQKGCYLGQEVVERMRSRQVVARQLIGLRVDGQAAPDLQSQICDQDGKPAGLVTSACFSPLLGGPFALGYLKTLLASLGTRVTLNSPPRLLTGIVIDVPLAA